MRVAVILACAITVVLGNDSSDVVELYDNGCPKDPAIKKLIPHTSCDMFNLCSNGELVPFHCSGTTLYDIKAEQCEFSWKVDCGGRNMSDSTPSPPQEIVTDSTEDGDNSTCNCDPSEAPEICALPENDGALVAHDNCNFFFKCSNGNPVAFRCPKNTGYNPYKTLCDWYENINCGNRTMSDDNEDSEDNDSAEKEVVEPVDNNHVNATAICAQEGSEGILIPHNNCNWFYFCSDGQLKPQVCPSNLNFNPHQQSCDWPENVNCGNKTVVEAKPEDNDGETTTMVSVIDGPVNDDPAQVSEICARSGSNGVLVAHEMCNQFFTCDSGRPKSLRCPENLFYNPLKKQCDWFKNVDCGNRTIPDAETDIDTTTVDSNDEVDDGSSGPVYDNPAEAQAICAQENSDGVLIASGICSQFYICDAFSAVTMNCGKGLYFNPKTRWCDWYKNVDCGNRTIAEDDDIESDDTEKSVNDNPAKAPEICAQAGSNGVLVAHENCNQYYKCHAGEPMVLSCSNNLLYDVQNEWCDRAEGVDCGNRIKPENDSDTENPEMATEICARAQSDGVLVAHKNCNQYYKCSHGVPVELQCLGDLLYNIELSVCDWSTNVNCGNRQQ